MASAEELGGLFACLPAEEKQKFIRQLSSEYGGGERDVLRGSIFSAPAKKAVNSFMAFRCKFTQSGPPILLIDYLTAYYSALFTGLPQKERSPFLRRLYDADPFHAEWEFVAMVYSHLRNEVLKLGKQAPIRTFLATACPIMNIIAPDKYLAACGWRLISVGDSNKQHELERDEGGELRLGNLRKSTPSLSGFDLFLHCLANGYDMQNSQGALCRMMERQEHLMTKGFFLNTDTTSTAAFQQQQQQPAQQQSDYIHGDFHTWQLDNKPSPTTRNIRTTHETAVAEQGDHHLIQFDDMRNPSPTDGTLSEHGGIGYHIEMPMAAYKYGPEDEGDGFQEAELARWQMREIADNDGTADGCLAGLDARGEEHLSAEESGSWDLFGYHGDFGDSYMNGTLGFGHGDPF